MRPTKGHSDCWPLSTFANADYSPALIEQLIDLVGRLEDDSNNNIQLILSQTQAIFRSAFVACFDLDKRKPRLVCRSGWRIPQNFPAQLLLDDNLVFATTIKGGKEPVAIADLDETGFGRRDPMVAKFAIKAYLGCPLLVSGKLQGALAVFFTQRRTFDGLDLKVLVLVSELISIEYRKLESELALRKSEARYRGLYKLLRMMADNIPDLVWAKDMQDRYMFVNQAMCDKLLMCGHPEKAIGKTDLYFARRQRQAGFQHTFGQICVDSDALTKSRKAAGRFLEEGLVRNRPLVLDVHKAPFIDDRGIMIGTVGCGRDVTREREIEAGFERQRSLLKRFFENAPAIMWVLDGNWTITLASQYWLESLGYKKDQVIGKRLDLFFALPGSGRLIEDLENALQTEARIEGRRLRLLNPDGKQLDVLVSMVADFDGHGKFAGAFAFAVAVGDDLKSQLASRRLEQARRMQTISTLAGGIAHQFNNALAVILGNLEMLETSEIASEPLKKYTGPIAQASKRLVQLTSQLLAYARGGKYQAQAVETRQFILDILRIVRHTLSADIKLELELDDEVAPVIVDITQIQELMAAVLSNASEALGGHGKVTIRLRNVELDEVAAGGHAGLRPGSYVQLVVEDDGPGMDEETRNRIFEPFFTTKFQGRGLGMAAVYGIVKQHNGWIGVESAPGKGTQVSVYLPTADSSRPRRDQKKAVSSGRQSERPAGAVLVVEDEELVMEVDCAIVNKLGYPVIRASSGREALSKLRAYGGPIAFVLLDVILPDMEGSRLYPLLKSERPDLKVVVCSGYSMEGPAKEIMDAGAEGFIQKPFSAFQLKQVIDDTLVNSR